MFNEFELTRISRELVDFVSRLKPQTLNSIYFKLFDSVEISGYFLCSIKKEFGFFKKRILTLQKFAEECDLNILSENLKRLEEVVTHCELLRRY